MLTALRLDDSTLGEKMTDDEQSNIGYVLEKFLHSFFHRITVNKVELKH